MELTHDTIPIASKYITLYTQYITISTYLLGGGKKLPKKAVITVFVSLLAQKQISPLCDHLLDNQKKIDGC